MNLRLSFAITVYLNADILLFDEVFSVGDYNFQQKCISKLLELNSEGKTIIVVTHNFKMIEYSKKTIILDEGKIIDYTDTSNVIRDNKYYFSILYQAPAYKSDFGEMSSNDKCIKLLTTEIYNAKDKSTKLCMNDELEIHTEFELLKGDKKYEIAYVIFQHGVSVLSVNSTNCSDRKNLFSSKGRYKAAIRIPGNLFNAGLFSLSIYFFTGDNHVVLMKKDTFFFPIEKGENMPEGKNSYLGPFQPLVEWNVSYEI
jgi:hypothetical protein